MPRATLIGTTCWGESWRPVVLTRDPAHYDRVADLLHEVAPPDWMAMTASVVISGKGRRACSVGPTCGSAATADDGCIRAIHDAIMELGSRCLAPRGMEWMGIWIDHDFTEGLMVVRMMHGGPARPGTGGHERIPGVENPSSATVHRALAA